VTVRHLLVTNDFPPKTGGIQSYLWELWRRLPADDVTVLTTPHDRAARFDADQAFRVVRTREPVLLPTPMLVRQIRRLADEVKAEVIVLDPALPLGLVGPALGRPYALVLHGSEVTVPGRLPVSRQFLAGVMQRSSLIIAGGGYPEAEALRAAGSRLLPPIVRIPPGVDTSRFVPRSATERARIRARLGVAPETKLVLSVSRLVPRKGMDTLIDAGARLAPSHPALQIAIGGSGRDRGRLECRIARTGAPARLLGWIADAELPDLYAAADIFVLCCRDRWGGLEQEGFGIIFLEAAAAGLVSVAGRSGGSAEAVVDGETGIVVDDPSDPTALADAIGRLLDDPDLARRQGLAARRRAEQVFSYDRLVEKLDTALDGMLPSGSETMLRPPEKSAVGAVGNAHALSTVKRRVVRRER
jgi:phosphatidylinositol alpha-1,6-mannosyltransferase